MGSKKCPANLKAWRSAVRDWSSLGGFAQLVAVNAYVNGHIRYADDFDVYGRADVWASPARSLGGRGDCEDYAIAKYESLRALGYAEHDLRIVVLNDTRKGIGHAVLSVRLGQGLFILDNQKPRPFLHDSVAYYSPVFSVNREGRWINIATRKIRAQYALAVEERGEAAASRLRLTEKTAVKAQKVAMIGTSDVVDTDVNADAVEIADASGSLSPPKAGGPRLPPARTDRAPAKKSAPPVMDGARELP